MKLFEEFVKRGTVTKQMPNNSRASSLLREAEKKKAFLEIALKNISSQQMDTNFIVDYCYDTILELLRAKLFSDGFNAGTSHEAEVSYLRVLGFPEPQVIFLNEMRYFRNGTKYYGTILMMDYALKVLDFMNKIYPRLKELAQPQKRGES